MVGMKKLYSVILFGNLAGNWGKRMPRVVDEDAVHVSVEF